MTDYSVGSAPTARLVLNLEAIKDYLEAQYRLVQEPESEGVINCLMALTGVTRAAPTHTILRGGYRSLYYLILDLGTSDTHTERKSTYREVRSILERH